jgi:predicted RNase H-like nuclease
MERLADRRIVAHILSTEQLFADADEFAVLAIDIPIGLPDDGPREVDRYARSVLGAPRASSVFPAPVRAALDGTSYADACARSFSACGKRLSKQAFAILPKIREVDRALRNAVHLVGRIREVHPEVCFFELNAQRPMAHSKRKLAGLSERVQLLDVAFGPLFREMRSSLAPRAASSDDIADALVALWSAERVRAGAHRVLQGQSTHDRFGLPMEMVA